MSIGDDFKKRGWEESKDWPGQFVTGDGDNWFQYDTESGVLHFSTGQPATLGDLIGHFCGTEEMYREFEWVKDNFPIARVRRH